MLVGPGLVLGVKELLYGGLVPLLDEAVHLVVRHAEPRAPHEVRYEGDILVAGHTPASLLSPDRRVLPADAERAGGTLAPSRD